ncbi:lysine N6-hydroxylase [Salsuginibacillus halophilus]|uniref:L-lysine N6-monooxygenase MbtG n=1 Tax=Salsuginibacillus halophilus TaxID=517424 RepID=A0A2P8HBH4_9BACI|nr:SidA/IucD/PvdA family monooxygenase [Salsuginibacillus halophilus]PSL43574.1 lysine N6-hydroxylase [Salsuginibacillus halophilus]
MSSNKKYDFIGIGIGPFNLGLAALSDSVNELETAFFEQDASFVWHPGMLLEGTVLNSSFIADLVTFADPTSRYTFLNYLHEHNRLYKFFFNKTLHMPRKEYENYGRWVADQLDSCHFSSRVEDVTEEADGYAVHVRDLQTDQSQVYYTNHVVVGTGTAPQVPGGLENNLNEDVCHSSTYRYEASHMKQSDKIVVVGAGQSAAEIFHDLLKDQKHFDYHLTWLTRSHQFFQAEEAKLAREIFSPDYVRYFRSLHIDNRLEALPPLDQARKGIEPDTLMAIYELLYHRSVEDQEPQVTLQPLSEVNDVKYEQKSGRYTLEAYQHQKEEHFQVAADKVIMATGFTPKVPDWLNRFDHVIEREGDNYYKVTDDFQLSFTDRRRHSIYMLTNLDHSHGSAATNLGLSVFRNQIIINSIMGREVYPLKTNTVFQQFMPSNEV